MAGVPRKRIAFALAVIAAGVVAATAAASVSFVVRGDARIGTYAVQRDGTLAGAIRAFGSPDTKTPRYSEGCLATWQSYGLTILFYNLGGQNPCLPRSGYFSRAIMRGTRWQTASSLRIGMLATRVRQFYARATWHHGLPGYWPTGWWLITRWSRIGGGNTRPGLLAETRNRRIVSLQVRFPAGGD